MGNALNKVWLVVSTIVLAGGFMFLFFGGTWEGVRFGLEIFGVVFILQTAHSVLKEGEQEKKERRDAEKITEKYF